MVKIKITRVYPIYTFSPEKNLTLIHERNISFEEIISAIENGFIVDIVDHPKQDKYKNQKIYVIKIKDYIFLVPFVLDDNGHIFLKTIIPSRKANKKYNKANKNETE